jgi:2-dehydropantoate 2-reductase
MKERVLIWGAGAIGGTIGAALAHAGHDVTFVDIVPEHVAAIAAGRLAITGPVRAFTTGAPAFTPETLRGVWELVLLAVKAHHTEAAARMLAPHLAAEGAVVSCQNGMNEPVIAEVVGRPRTVGAFVNFGADWQAPGEIMFGNRGAVVVGELDGARSERIVRLHRLLSDFEPAAVITDNIWGYLFGKEGYGAVLKASALTNDTIADFIAAPENRALIVALVREVLAVARAEGVSPLGFDGYEPLSFLAGEAAAIERSIAAMVAFNRNSGKQRSGIWRDLAVRRRASDAGAQLAPVIAAGRRHGMAMTFTARLVALIGAVERGEATVGEGLIERLRQDVPGRAGAARRRPSRVRS